MPKGRPKKVSVTLSKEEFHVLAARLGYSDQVLRDDLAMGLIPPVAPPVAPPTAMPEGKSAEVTRHGSKPDLVGKEDSKTQSKSPQKLLSWADEEEIEDALRATKEKAAQQPEKQELQKQDEPLKAKSWAAVVKDADPDMPMELEFIKPGMTVEFTKEEWEEGNSIWKHVVVGSVVSIRPSYADVMRWVDVNWKAYKPRVSHIRPGVYLFEFQSEEDKWDILGKSWSFYHKSQISLKAWDVNGCR